MRIALDARVIQDHFPGIGRYVYRLTEALATEAHDCSFHLLCEADQAGGRFDLEALSSSENVHCAPLAGGARPQRGRAWPGLASQWRARQTLRRTGAGLFHATYWWGPYWPGTRATVLSLYDLTALRLPEALPTARRMALALALRLSLRSADQVLTLSAWSRTDLLRHYRLDPGRISVTPLAADPALAPAEAHVVAELRARLQLPERYVLYLGINKPHKNLAMLISAWARLFTELPREGREAPVLALAGPWDPRYDDLKRQADALAPTAGIRFLGPIAEADLAALYTGATVFAFPSLYEGFGLPPLEAMACGVPVLAADATSLPEVLGEAGILLPPDDLGAWSAALAAVLADPQLGAELGARGRLRSVTFTWPATAKATLAAYRQAWARAKHGRR